MGVKYHATADYNSKSQYQLTREAGDAITLNDGELGTWYGSDIFYRRVEANSGLLKCIQAMRERGWPNPDAGNFNTARFDLNTGALLVTLNTIAPLPVAAETEVMVIQGNAFTVSHDSNSAHCRRMLEVFNEQLIPGNPIPPGLAFSFSRTNPNGEVRVILGAGTNAMIEWNDGSPPEAAVGAGNYDHTYGAGGSIEAVPVIAITGIIEQISFAGNPITTAGEPTVYKLGNSDVSWIGDMVECFSDTGNGMIYYGAGHAELALTGGDITSLFQNTDLDAVTELDLSTWTGTGTIKQTTQMFLNAGNTLLNVNMSGWDMSANIQYALTFNELTALSLDVSGVSFTTDTQSQGGLSLFDQSTHITNITGVGMTFNPDGGIGGMQLCNTCLAETMNFEGLIVAGSGDCTDFFNGTVRALNINIDGMTGATSLEGSFRGAGTITQNCVMNVDCDTSAVTDLTATFQITSGSVIGLENWDVTAVTAMRFLFDQSILGSVDVTNWNPLLCQDFGYLMTESTTALIGYENWNVSSGTNFYGVFQTYTGLASIDVSAWDTSAGEDMSFMFNECAADTVNVTDLNFNACTNGRSMFMDYLGLATGLETWDIATAPVELNLSFLFSRCIGIDFSFAAWDFSTIAGATATGNMNICQDASGFSQANLDSFVAKLYADRLSLAVSTKAISFTGTSGLTGIYQDAAPPTTGLEYAFKLNNNPDVEAFTPTAITGVGIA